MRQYGGSAYKGGCHPAVTESAKYNITTVVGLCSLCIFFSVPMSRKGFSLLSIFPLSLPNLQHFYFIRHLTCLSSNQSSSSRRTAKEHCPSPVWYSSTTTFKKPLICINLFLKSQLVSHRSDFLVMFFLKTRLI